MRTFTGYSSFSRRTTGIAPSPTIRLATTGIPVGSFWGGTGMIDFDSSHTSADIRDVRHERTIELTHSRYLTHPFD